MPARLQKILAAAGIASRRKAEEIIAAGRVTLNGQIVTEQGTKADPLHDTICVDGKPLHRPQRFVYFLLNKPKGYVTTVSDPEGRPTVMQLLGELPRARLSRWPPRLRQRRPPAPHQRWRPRPKTHQSRLPHPQNLSRQNQRQAQRKIPPAPPRRHHHPPRRRPPRQNLSRQNSSGRRRPQPLVRSRPHRRPQSPNPPHVPANRLPRRKNQAHPTRPPNLRRPPRQIPPPHRKGSAPPQKSRRPSRMILRLSTP